MRISKKLAVSASITAAVILAALLYLYTPLFNSTGGRLAGVTNSQRYLPSVLDGSGSAVVHPDADITAGSRGTWKIVYTADGSGIAKGGGVAFHIPPFWGWSPPQNIAPSSPGYCTVSCSQQGSSPDIQIDSPNHYILVRMAKKALKKGSTITVIYGDTQNDRYPEAQALADRYAERGERFFIKVDGDGDGFFSPINSHPSLNVLPGSPVKLIVTAPSIVTSGSAFSIMVSALDRAENWITAYDADLHIVPFDNATITTKKKSNAVPSITCRLSKPGIYRFAVQDTTAGMRGVSNPVVCADAPPQRMLYWADLHGHSRLSDGSGTPEQYYTYARKAAGLDAAALTDHDAWGFDLLDEHDNLWSFIKSETNRFNDPGRFITLMGYEWTNWEYGHKHVLFLNEPAPLFSSRSPNADTPKKLWACLKNTDSITVSHHPGGGPISADWNFYDSEYEPVVEICSIHGNSECRNCPQCIYRPQNGAFVRDALSRGYRLGIIASGDTHNGHPGMGDPLSPIGGIMGFYAPELTRKDLWQALKNRTVYGTTGARLIVDFTINGLPMGTVSGQPPSSGKVFFIKVIGTAAIEQIDIVRNGSSVKSWQSPASPFVLRFTQDYSETGFEYYYLRVIQKDGHMAWTSPIWFEETSVD